MKQIEWIAGERDVCGVGTVTTGDIKELPDSMADNLIKQGMAKLYVKPITKKTKEATK